MNTKSRAKPGNDNEIVMSHSVRSNSFSASSRKSVSKSLKKDDINIPNPKKSISNSSINERINEFKIMNYLKEQDILLSKPLIIKNINKDQGNPNF